MKDKVKKELLFILGEELRDARERKGFTREKLSSEMSNKIGITLGSDSIKAYELGKRNMPATTLLAFAYVLELDMEKLKKHTKQIFEKNF